MKTLFWVLLIVPLYVYAAEPPAVAPAKETAPETAPVLTEPQLSGRELRAKTNYFSLLNYSPLDLILPNKIGVTAGVVSDPSTTWELEYLRASVSVPFVVNDLGATTDQRISVIRRSYGERNHFNFGFGISYFDFSVHIGDEMLSRLTAGSYPDIDLLQIQSLGFNLSLGHRWILGKGITLGADWFSWAQPVFVLKKKNAFLHYATNQEDRDDVDKAIKLITYVPRLAFLKLQLGYSF